MSEIERIQKMELALDEVTAAYKGLSVSLAGFSSKLGQLRALSAYYGSEAYHHDLAMDEGGQLPSGLKRGVLSQDAVYDLLMDLRELADEMHAVADAIIRDGAE